MRPPVPSGEGLVARRVRLAERDVVLLGGLLHGEDHLASIHGEDAARGGRVTVSIVTTSAREHELDVWLADIAETVELERL